MASTALSTLEAGAHREGGPRDREAGSIEHLCDVEELVHNAGEAGEGDVHAGAHEPERDGLPQAPSATNAFHLGDPRTSAGETLLRRAPEGPVARAVRHVERGGAPPPLRPLVFRGVRVPLGCFSFV